MLCSPMYAQTYEIGLMLGGTNYTGDVGSTSYAVPQDYFNADKLSYGGIFKWNRSLRHTFRFSVLNAKTFGDDADSSINRRKERDYRFEQSMTEFSAAIEYTFWEWDPHRLGVQTTPYLATGPTLLLANHHYVRNEQLVEGKRYTTFAIPMIIGVKSNIHPNWVLAFEFGARYTFSDNIDGSAPMEMNEDTNFVSFGNPNTNDWYMFAGITLTYSFGRKPCYCNF